MSFDGVGVGIWEVLFDLIGWCGMIVSYGNVDGLVIGVNLGILV